MTSRLPELVGCCSEGMSDHIKISVDGQHGVIAARNGGIRFVGAHDEMALARVSMVIYSRFLHGISLRKSLLSVISKKSPRAALQLKSSFF